jgi:hypothetical protein
VLKGLSQPDQDCLLAKWQSLDTQDNALSLPTACLTEQSVYGGMWRMVVRTVDLTPCFLPTTHLHAVCGLLPRG